MNYIENLEKGRCEINNKKLFNTLSIKEEREILNYYIEYLTWFSHNENKIILKYKKITSKLIVELFLQEIGKPIEVENILNKFECITSLYEYTEYYYEKYKFMFILNDSKKFFNKKDYRTEEQKEKLLKLKNIKEIKEFFEKYNYNENFINKIIAERIIRKYYI